MTSLITTWAGSYSNCYVDFTDANSYIAVSVDDPSTWTAASTVRREAALLRATRTIDSAVNWQGEKKYQYQTLKFPRSTTVGELQWPWSLSIQVSGTSTQEEEIMKARIKEATALQANYVIADLDGTDEHALNQRRGISSYSESLGGKLSESFSYKTVTNRLCTEAMELLKAYTSSGATLVRG